MNNDSYVTLSFTHHCLIKFKENRMTADLNFKSVEASTLVVFGPLGHGRTISPTKYKKKHRGDNGRGGSGINISPLMSCPVPSWLPFCLLCYANEAPRPRISFIHSIQYKARPLIREHGKFRSTLCKHVKVNNQLIACHVYKSIDFFAQHLKARSALDLERNNPTPSILFLEYSSICPCDDIHLLFPRCQNKRRVELNPAG